LHRIVYQQGDYIIKKLRKGYYVYNRHRRNGEHTHIRSMKESKELIECIYNNRVPADDYLKVSLLRICPDKKLKNEVEIKIEKDKQKQKFYKPQMY